MIDYLEDLLEEEAAVELNGVLLTPVGRRKVPPWQEEGPAVGTRQEESGRDPVEKGGGHGEEEAGRGGSPSWAEGQTNRRTTGAALLSALTRTALAAGQIRQQGRPLAVTLAGEVPRAVGPDLEAMDRAVQRDARRYDGGFPLY